VAIAVGIRWTCHPWAGVLPSVMADEWHYSLLARLLPLSQSDAQGSLTLDSMGWLCLCWLCVGSLAGLGFNFVGGRCALIMQFYKDTYFISIFGKS
jgi:hypothetical protein